MPVQNRDNLILDMKGLKTVAPQEDTQMDPQFVKANVSRRKKNFLCFCIISAFLSVTSLLFVYFYNALASSYKDTAICSNAHVPRGDLQETTLAATIKRPLTGMWTINVAGRLGNIMGEYASLYALARQNGHGAYILPEMHNQLSKIFKIQLPVLHQEVSNHITWRNYNVHNWMSPEYNHIQGEYVRLTGFPWSHTFYHHLRDEILQEFSFHHWITEESHAYLSKIRGDRKNVTFVGVHVRRGDYVRVMPSRKGVIADKVYLQKATDYFRNRYKNPVFVVSSNGMDWCKENINHSLGDVHFAGDGREGSPSRDFALLAHCNHTIMTIGTFGYWIGYLVGGETVYLSNYILPNSTFLNIFKYEAAFLPEWVGIPADLSPLLKTEIP